MRWLQAYEEPRKLTRRIGVSRLFARVHTGRVSVHIDCAGALPVGRAWRAPRIHRLRCLMVGSAEERQGRPDAPPASESMLILGHGESVTEAPAFLTTSANADDPDRVEL